MHPVCLLTTLTSFTGCFVALEVPCSYLLIESLLMFRGLTNTPRWQSFCPKSKIWIMFIMIVTVGSFRCSASHFRNQSLIMSVVPAASVSTWRFLIIYQSWRMLNLPVEWELLSKCIFKLKVTPWIISVHSRFVYPAVVIFIIATITFPKGFGQFMAGEVSVPQFITATVCCFQFWLLWMAY